VHVDPPVKALFAGLPPAAVPEDLGERRTAANDTFKLLRVAEPGTSVEDHEIPVAGGAVRVRVIRPSDAAGPLPGLLFLHGGGWFQGDLDTAEVECGPMATAVGCVVVSVDYRLAPEHPYPVPLEDCLTAWQWLHSCADRLGIDPGRVAVAGTSAGGNLAAALCLLLRDRGLPLPIAQLLDVPATDLTLASPSLGEYDTRAGLTAAEVEQFATWYAGDTPRTDPYLSPVLAPDLSGLPPAVVIVAEHDPVRDDGERWVRALQEAGVPAMGVRVLTHLHGTWVLPFTVTSGLVQDLRQAALRRAFAGTLVPMPLG
jgi:acetyl esterase